MYTSYRVSGTVLPYTFCMPIAYQKLLQGLMEHIKFELTVIYLRIFALDMAAGQQVWFTLNTASAVSLLRDRQGI